MSESRSPIDSIKRQTILGLTGSGLLHVHVEQSEKGLDAWELIIAYGSVDFEVMHLTSDTLKKLSDFFGEMARIGSRFPKTQEQFPKPEQRPST